MAYVIGGLRCHQCKSTLISLWWTLRIWLPFFLISGDYFHCLLRLVPLRVFRLSILYSIFLVSFLFPASSLFRSPLDPW